MISYKNLHYKIFSTKKNTKKALFNQHTFETLEKYSRALVTKSWRNVHKKEKQFKLIYKKKNEEKIAKKYFLIGKRRENPKTLCKCLSYS